jgi:Zn-dependent protease
MDINSIFTWIVPLIVAITFHEVAHGYVARIFGDPTADKMGRINLNPLRHIDPFGTVIMPMVLALSGAPVFGYAKPVPVDMRYFKRPRRDMMWVAAAGPAMNLALATLAMALIAFLLPLFGKGQPTTLANFIGGNLFNFLMVNLSLAVFNMIPIPPLDGGKVLAGLLPDKWGQLLYKFENKGMFVLIGLLVILPMVGTALNMNFNFLGKLIGPPIDFLVGVLASIFGIKL